MPQTNTGVCALGDLTVRELANLHILNKALREVEHWTIGRTENGATCVAVIVGSGGNGKCSYTVARLNAAKVAGLATPRVFERESDSANADLFGINPCGLFKALIAELEGDWLQMLQVRVLSIETLAGTQHKIEIPEAFVRRKRGSSDVLTGDRDCQAGLRS
jgi:NAD(P)H-hydrate repair Nnr-like enzyme with NAD(P)H-hydrate epimerase domain